MPTLAANLTTTTIGMALDATMGKALNDKVDVINGNLAGKANANHTHNYAGSSSPGGKANSAAYSDSAGNADTVDGQHASAFAPSNHSHNYLPLNGGTLSGGLSLNGANLLNVNTVGGASAGLTINGAYSTGGANLFLAAGSYVYVSNSSNNAEVPLWHLHLRCSSQRYKEHIMPIPESEARKILDVNVVTFDYKNDSQNSGTNVAGVIAEEVDKIIPYAVVKIDLDGENVPDGVDYTKFIPYLIKLIQEQEQRITVLEELVKVCCQ